MLKKKLMFLASLSILILSFIACGESSSANTGTKSSPNGSTPATQAKHFQKGDVVTVGSIWKVTVNNVTTNTGDDFNKPTKGVYLVVDITLNNISNQEQNLSSLISFQMKSNDGKGVQYTEAVVGNLSGVNPSPNGKVEAGQPVSGDLVYDVPSDVKAFTLSFSPDITASGATQWDLNV